MVLGSSPVAVTSSSDFVPASSKEFLDIQATIECGFTLKRVRDMTRTYSQLSFHIYRIYELLVEKQPFGDVLQNGCFKNFAISTGKHVLEPPWRPATLFKTFIIHETTQLFSSEYWEYLKKPFITLSFRGTVKDISLSQMKITVSATRSSYKDRGPCYLYLPIFSYT